MNIKEAEKLTGISKRNIRFYEQKGMLHPARNQDNDYRDYSSQDIERLKLIRALRMVDMPLEEIQKVLDGKTSLEEAATAQERQLRERVQEVQTAIRFCRTLSKVQVGADVDDILRQMEQPENISHLFSQWVDDYKQLHQAWRQKEFTFQPDDGVTNPQEFTMALCQYAQENHLDLDITKEGMYPEFTLNGVEYTADRYYARVGGVPLAVIRCTAKHPEELEPEVSQPVGFLFSVFHNSVPYLILLAVAVFLLLQKEKMTAGVVTAFVVLVYLSRLVRYFWKKRENRDSERSV